MVRRGSFDGKKSPTVVTFQLVRIRAGGPPTFRTKEDLPWRGACCNGCWVLQGKVLAIIKKFVKQYILLMKGKCEWRLADVC